MQNLKFVVMPCEFSLEMLEKFVVAQLKLDGLNMVVFWKGEVLRYFLEVGVFLRNRLNTSGIAAVMLLLGLQIGWFLSLICLMLGPLKYIMYVQFPISMDDFKAKISTSFTHVTPEL
jgi:hypothetical protein